MLRQGIRRDRTDTICLDSDVCVDAKEETSQHQMTPTQKDTRRGRPYWRLERPERLQFQQQGFERDFRVGLSSFERYRVIGLHESCRAEHSCDYVP